MTSPHRPNQRLSLHLRALEPKAGMASCNVMPEQLHDTFSTNTSSKFKRFKLTLSNGATLTGICHIPPRPCIAATGKPLLVGIHGGTCSAYTWDVSPQYTASTYSDILGIPFVAFNRPNFLDSSGWLVDRSSPDPQEPRWQAEEGNSYFEEEGRWLHSYILPALWEHFAVPNGCTAIVTNSHSMGVPITIIAAGHYSSQPLPERQYTWAGIVLSGADHVRTETCIRAAEATRNNPRYEPQELPLGQDDTIHVPPFRRADKEDLMLGPRGLTDDTLRHLIAKGTTPFLLGEVMNLSTWPMMKEKYQAAVKIPVLCALAEYDWVWQGTKENVEAFCKSFVNAPRVEGARVNGSGHAIELSRVSTGWWLRVFGFAIEVTAGLTVAAECKGLPNF